jgi:hypothetical protein
VGESDTGSRLEGSRLEPSLPSGVASRFDGAFLPKVRGMAGTMRLRFLVGGRPEPEAMPKRPWLRLSEKAFGAASKDNQQGSDAKE